MCINSVKETCFSHLYQKWICLILELNSSIVNNVSITVVFPSLFTLFPDSKLAGISGSALFIGVTAVCVYTWFWLLCH